MEWDKSWAQVIGPKFSSEDLITQSFLTLLLMNRRTSSPLENRLLLRIYHVLRAISCTPNLTLQGCESHFVSRVHCVIYLDERIDYFLIENYGRHGTIVDGVKLR